MHRSHLKYALHLSIGASLLALTSYVGTAHAADFTIVNGQTETTTQTLNSNGDTGVVESGGVIATTLNNEYAIEVNGADVTVRNNGSISTLGSSAFGFRLLFSDDVTANNSGSITTSGDFAYGINSSGNNATISNSGSITTTGNSASGYLESVGANSTFTNSGSITTTGSGARGVRSGSNDFTLINSGSITTSSDSVFVSGTDATINNSGSITTSGLFNSGIFSNNTGTTLINSGTIIASGDNSSAVNVSGSDAIVSNSGTIIATGVSSNAILGGAGAQTLNIGEGSRIIGTIDLGAGTDTVNITDASQSGQITFVGVENVNLGAGVTGVVAGNSVVLVDTTGQSAQTQSAPNITQSVHNVINNHAKKNTQSGISSGDAYSNVQAWGEVFGSTLTRDGESARTSSYDHDYAGIAGGYERDLENDWRLGVIAGYSVGKIRTKSKENKTDVDSFFAGLSAQKSFSDLKVNANLIAGYESYDNQRAVTDNIAGDEVASSNFDNVFISPSVAVEYTHAISETFALRPSASVTYTASFYDDYSENGTTSSNLSFDNRTVQTWNTRAGMAGVFTFDNTVLELRTGVDGRFTNEEKVGASLAGANFSYATSDDDSVLGGYVGFGAEVAASHGITFNADTELRQASGGETQISGRLRVSYKF